MNLLMIRRMRVGKEKVGVCICVDFFQVSLNDMQHLFFFTFKKKICHPVKIKAVRDRASMTKLEKAKEWCL